MAPRCRPATPRTRTSKTRRSRSTARARSAACGACCATHVKAKPEARAAWKLEVSQVTDRSAHWEAHYLFSATGRKVLNRIDAEFEFDHAGLIVRHRDRFDFWAWSRQALGLPGVAARLEPAAAQQGTDPGRGEPEALSAEGLMAEPARSDRGRELAAATGRAQLSPLEVAQAVIAHIEPLGAAHPRHLGLRRPTARSRRHARPKRAGSAVSLRRRSTACRSTIKENIATRGVPVPLGSAATELVPATEDAPPAARLREAGAVLLAKTTMPDFGMLSSGLSSFHAADAQPVGPEQGPRRQQRRRRRGGGRRLRPAAPGHRHRRLDPPARRLVRRRRLQAQRRPHPDQAALPGPRGRPDDAHAWPTPR